MRILVLDTIHGGKFIAEALRNRGHETDMVDVYREKEGISPGAAGVKVYDLVISPVHLDPAYPLLRGLCPPVISHHQAVKWIIGDNPPRPFIEVTGARGKTTTAHALAHLMAGPGVLHTSLGTTVYPSREIRGNRGITPASLIDAAGIARSVRGWLVAEISLGFSGAGDLGILTSSGTYRFAGGKKNALGEKIRSGRSLPAIITPPGTPRTENMIPADEIAVPERDACRYDWEGIRGEFRNPLLTMEAYRDPLAMAAAAACVLGIDPLPLSTFALLPGRMNLSWQRDIAVVDDSNSGTCAATARQAIRLARQEAGLRRPLTLVIGKEDGAVCEGFPAEDIAGLIETESPDMVILVGKGYCQQIPSSVLEKVRFTQCDTYAEGKEMALECAGSGMVVLAVKAWR